ncbi:MAG: hypothetical protein ACYTFG_15945 [Planctomycetota bacterium]
MIEKPPPRLPRTAARTVPAVAENQDGDIPTLVNEIQLLLAEKRTALSVLRTGIAVFALPLSVFSVLIATSKFYDASGVVHFLLPVLAINAGLISLAVYLLLRSVRRLRNLDRLVGEIKTRSPVIAGLIT